MPNKLTETVAFGTDKEPQEILGIRGFQPTDHVAMWKEPQSPTPGASGEGAHLFHLIAQNVCDYAIFAQDANGSILSWNRGVAAVLGYNEDEFVGKHVSLIFTAEDVKNGDVDEQMREAKVAGRATDRKWHVRRDGSRFWANGLLMPLWDVDNTLQGYARVIRDDTEQKVFEDDRGEILRREREARRQAELLRESLERAEREKDEFLAVLAHELRNPLNAILGWLTILRKGRTDERLLTKGLETIEASAKSQDRLIEDVFDLSRISSGNLSINAEPMFLNDAVAQAFEAIRPAANAKNISLETVAGAETIVILGDFDRIKQAIVNLLSNAVKFTNSGGRVRLSMICPDSAVRIIVEDNGRGFSSEFRPHIFDRYAQADKSSMGGRSGLGLGLPIVREIVEKHGGKVTAESKGDGLGATFTVYLPVQEAMRAQKHTGR